MGWLGDVFSGSVDAVPFLENPFNGNTEDNDQSIRGGRTEANRGIYWVGSNGHIYTKDGARGVVDRGTNYSVPGGYSRIADPNAPQSGSNTQRTGLPASDSAYGAYGTAAAAPKVLDEAQLRSLDSLLSQLDTVRNQTKDKARIKRDTSKREKEEERGREKGKYEGKKLSTLQDFAGAKNDTDLGTRDTLENLMSSLSTLGLGGSRALTRQILNAANKANRKANTTQAQNNQQLDSSWNEFDVGNKNDLLKIEDQFGYEQGEADRQWGQQRQNVLNKKADVYNQADRTAEREALMGEASGLNDFIGKAPFMNPQYTGAARAMATPELVDYTQDIARYDTSAVGADATGVTPVGAGVTPGAMPGNLAVRAIAVNDKDLGVKKKTEGTDLVLGV